MSQVLSDEERRDLLAHTIGRSELVNAVESAILAKLADKLKDAERYELHRSVGGLSWTVIETQKKAKGALFDSATDAAIDAQKGQPCP